MKMDRKLNIVIPVQQGTRTLYVHSSPISRGVFENYFMVLSRTFAAIYNQGLGAVAGPRVAAMMLRKIAQEAGDWEGDAGVERGLMAEIRRLTNVVMPDGSGWATTPFQEVRDRKLLDEDDIAEVENSLVFFTVASAMHRKEELPTVLGMMSNLWGAQIASSNSTEFAASLPTSTPAANTGETATPSRIPY